jgi:pimeloyl-ACP methyl ester carboxylesterase
MRKAMPLERCVRLLGYIGCILTTGIVLPRAAPPALAQATVPVIQWSACEPPTSAGFDCATVPVPRDYAHPDAGTITLAVIRHQASQRAGRIGTLFFNPGGPGGQGTEDLPKWFVLFPQPVRDRFDIVSWDPRGIGASTAVQCFANATDEANFFAGIPSDVFPVGFAQQTAWFQRLDEFAAICKQRNGDLLSHVSTADSARDMDLLRQAVGETMLNYLGISYGSYLGTVYANLFPDRIRAMILDGDIDPTVWNNAGQAQALLSDGVRFGSSAGAADSLQAFLDQCGQAGPGKCAFSTGDAAGTQAKLTALLERLKTAPGTLNGTQVTYAVILTALHGWMYTTLAEPGFSGWVTAANDLQSLWTASDPNAATSPSSASATPASATTEQAVATTTGAEKKYTGGFQASAVQCAESPNPRPPERFRLLDRLVTATYGPIGAVDLWADEPCASWQATAADKYQGPWDQPTSTTILVVGNTHDPSTPYSGAVSLSQQLARARLLTVDGYGHTAFLNPSQCAGAYESDYLINGTLPPEGTVCRQDALPFQ